MFSWGYGGKAGGFFASLLRLQVKLLENGKIVLLFSLEFSALGHEKNEDRHVPTLIKELRKYPPVVSITAGFGFSSASNSKVSAHSFLIFIDKKKRKKSKMIFIEAFFS